MGGAENLVLPGSVVGSLQLVGTMKISGWRGTAREILVAGTGLGQSKGADDLGSVEGPRYHAAGSISILIDVEQSGRCRSLDFKYPRQRLDQLRDNEKNRSIFGKRLRGGQPARPRETGQYPERPGLGLGMKVGSFGEVCCSRSIV